MVTTRAGLTAFRADAGSCIGGGMSCLRDLHVADGHTAACRADACLCSLASPSPFAVRLLGRMQGVTRAGAARLPVAGRKER
ncbi:hypothetical protein FHY31_001710 [Xanthomonas euvesicatoria]|uniref:Uncharacterized protein n=1 Tax=Xanthomonas euvesicatoria TaxID=456327 RepID=A0AAW3U3L8_XANEU|nr:hypothetical protein [Xanthomonas euvesicatoria]MBB4869966.1 hypothetical protein [Xanthomonas euvesicatoria]